MLKITSRSGNVDHLNSLRELLLNLCEIQFAAVVRLDLLRNTLLPCCANSPICKTRLKFAEHLLSRTLSRSTSIHLLSIPKKRRMPYPNEKRYELLIYFSFSKLRNVPWNLHLIWNILKSFVSTKRTLNWWNAYIKKSVLPLQQKLRPWRKIYQTDWNVRVCEILDW